MQEASRTSRAVLRFVEAGSSATCAHCTGAVQFRARIRAQQVICNVYDRGVWRRVEHYHCECYEAAGKPYGDVDASQPLRRRRTAATTAA
jgi:hypothetical protein